MRLTFILTLFIFISCNDEENGLKKSYFDSGEILSEISYNDAGYRDGLAKEYYKSGQLMKKAFYSEGKQIDTTFIFYPNGKVKETIIYTGDTIVSKGFHKNGALDGVGKSLRDSNLKIGWWKFYDESGNPIKQMEFINMKNKSYLNQLIAYLPNGNIDKEQSYFYSIEGPDSVKLGSEHKISFSYSSPNSNESELYLVIAEELNDDFSNAKTVHRDSIFMSLNPLEVNISFIENDKKEIKGYFLEKYLTDFRANRSDTDKLDATIFQRKLFFKKRITIIPDDKGIPGE